MLPYLHPCTGLLPWVFQSICKRSGQVMTNVEQSLQETFERNFSVVKCCQLNKLGLSTLRASSLVFFSFLRRGWGREGGRRGEKNGKESLKSFLRISQARVTDVKNKFQCLHFNLPFLFYYLHFEFLCNFYQTKRSFLLLVGSKQPYNSRKKKRKVTYNIYSFNRKS